MIHTGAIIVHAYLGTDPPTAASRATVEYRLGARGLEFILRVAGRQTSNRPRGAIAQLGERLDRTQEVRGSNPLSSIGPVEPWMGSAGAIVPWDRLCPPWVRSSRGWET
jgi:hypothetical protein